MGNMIPADKHMGFIAEMPFSLCVMIFETTLDVTIDQDNNLGLDLKRKYLGVSFAAYDVYVEHNIKLGEIHLQQVSSTGVLIQLRHKDADSLKFLQFILSKLWAVYQEYTELEQILPRISDIVLEANEVMIDPASLLERERRELNEPRKGASIERWLQYRDDQARRGRHIALVTIAKKSGHSLSTLKKQSAKRSQEEPNSTKKEPNSTS